MKENREMPLLGNMSTPVFRGADITKFIKPYESLASYTGTDPAADNMLAMYPEYYSEMIQQMIKIMNR
jgi:hypothetical protein